MAGVIEIIGALHVRFGSLADILRRNRDVRVTPKSGHQTARLECSLRGNDRNRRVNQNYRHHHRPWLNSWDCKPSRGSGHNFQKLRSCSIGLGALLFTYDESIEVDEPWIVRMGRPLEQPGTMNPYQGLHAPGI